MSVFALVRPDSWNFPLLLHVLGAIVLIGALVTAAVAQFLVWRPHDRPATVALSRFAFRSLLLGALPGWFLMRIAGQWTYSRERLDDAESDPAWIGIGFVTSELGGVLLVVSIVLAGLGVRRLRRDSNGDLGSNVLGRIAGVIATLLLLAYVVTVWAMTAKPA